MFLLFHHSFFPFSFNPTVSLIFLGSFFSLTFVFECFLSSTRLPASLNSSIHIHSFPLFLLILFPFPFLCRPFFIIPCFSRVLFFFFPVALSHSSVSSCSFSFVLSPQSLPTSLLSAAPLFFFFHLFLSLLSFISLPALTSLPLQKLITPNAACPSSVSQGYLVLRLLSL